jgi:hypothetical protein
MKARLRGWSKAKGAYTWYKLPTKSTTTYLVDFRDVQHSRILKIEAESAFDQEHSGQAN